jgi:endonuclease G, mitochondrial
MTRKQIYTILSAITIIGFYLLNDFIDAKIATNSNEEKNHPSSITNNQYLPNSTTGYIVHHDYYSLSYNEEHEQAEWIAYELKKNQLSRNQYKRPYFIQDKKIKTKSADWRNFKNSGYDKGHLCPAADRKFSKEAYNETFLTSNISPQNHDFNAGIWNRLEQKTRYWANKYNGIYVVTGGVLNNSSGKIGKEKVTVPNHFYKILLNIKNGKTKTIAFLIPHKETKEPLYKFVVSIDKIEKITGIDFFPKIEDQKENELENNVSYKNWSF